MSVRVMSWVWDNGPESASDRLVLLALADFADDAGRCYPSMVRIAQKACVKERGARQIVRRLEAEGWLETRVGGGRHGCNQYRILMQNPARETGNETAQTRHEKPGLEDPTPAPDCTKPGTRLHETRHGHAPEPSRTIIEPSPKNTAVFSQDEKAAAIAAEFDRVWEGYPRKVGKGAAERAWIKARKRADFETIANPLWEYIRGSRGVEQRFIPHLATWLHQRRWRDDQSHATNRARTSTEDLAHLSNLTSTEDLANLFPFPQRKAIR